MGAGRLVLLRHGQSTWNLENLFTGWVDVDLSPQGLLEAQEAGRLLKAEGFAFDQAFTSVLKRAIRTLWITLDQLDQMFVAIRLGQLDVHAGAHREQTRLLAVACHVVAVQFRPLGQLANGVVIGDDESVEAPLAAQHVAQEPAVGVRRHAVDLVVRGHDAHRVAFVERLLKRYPKLGPAKIFDALAFAYDNEEVIEADLERDLQRAERLVQVVPVRDGPPTDRDDEVARLDAGRRGKAPVLDPPDEDAVPVRQADRPAQPPGEVVRGERHAEARAPRRLPAAERIDPGPEALVGR